MRLKGILAAVAACVLGIAFPAFSSAAPPVIDSFNWLDSAGPTDGVGMFDWNESGGGDYEQRDECDPDMTASCDFFSGNVPIVRAGDPGSYPAGSKAEWVYTVPGGPDAYVKEVSGVGINAQFGSGPIEPHAFLGLWDGSSWSEISTQQELAGVQLEEVAGVEGDRQVKFGLEADTTGAETGEHWAGLGNLMVTLGDDVSPELNFDPGDIPTGWVSEEPISISAPALDNGLGLAIVLAATVKRGSTPWAAGGAYNVIWGPGCQGDTANPCPAETPDGFEIELDPTQIREGYNVVSLAAADAMYNVQNDNLGDQFDLYVDTIKPKVELSGSFMSAPGMVLDGPVYELDSLATDGELGKANSGVTDLRVLIDDEWVESESEPCATENCQLGFDTWIDPDHYSNGPHTLKVKATDAVGHVKTETVEFEVDR